MPVRILIADDASFIRDMVKKNIRARIPDVQMFEATDGNKAIAVLKKNNIDIILSDWEMPEMSGEELLQWVRSQDQYNKTPFVMVSSRGDKEHIVKAIEAGVSDYLTKPFTPEELLKKVAKQLAKIGKDPNLNFGGGADGKQGHAFGSVSALTGGAGQNLGAKKPGQKKPASAVKNSGLLNPPTPAASKVTASKKGIAKKSAAATSGTSQAKAQLRFPNSTCDCDVRDISLQALVGVIKRSEIVPTIFDQAVVDIETPGEQDLARINAYVHTIQANGNNIGADSLKITVRFVDNDPTKFETLSKFIAKNR